MDKIILVNKPSGMTSFEVVKWVKRKFNVNKAGHAGTLDPLAEGLMIVGIEEGTKQLKHYVGLDKVYEAEIILGERRSTGDMEGEILEECKAINIPEDSIKKTLASLVGNHTLPVSLYSAMKRGGEPYYKKVRRGEKMRQPLRVMEIKKVELKKVEEIENRTHVFVTFHVGSGTYIRSLAEELGKKLGLPATLGNLKRIAIDKFSIESSIEAERS